MIDIFDNVLENHVAEWISHQMLPVSWIYEHKAEKKDTTKYWHVLCGKNPEEIEKNEFDWLLPVWYTALSKYNFKERYKTTSFKRLYLNAHTYGIEPDAHIDDGDITMIYYPRMDWKKEWGGGTAIWDNAGENIEKVSDYVGNRLIVFPAHRLHRGLPVFRNCYELRSVLVIKAIVDLNLMADNWLTTRENIPEKYIQYLEQLGAHQVQHTKSSQSLMEHFIGTYNILKEYQVPEYVQDAGLFHSIYDATYFKNQNTINREEVRQLIGIAAEELVFLFCSLEHPILDKINRFESMSKRYALRMINRATLGDTGLRTKKE